MKVTGVKIEKFANGSLKSATFDLKKHGSLISPILEKLGVIKEDEFEKRWKEGHTVDNAKKETIKMFKDLCMK